MQTETNNAPDCSSDDLVTANSSKTGNEPSKEQVEELLEKCL